MVPAKKVSTSEKIHPSNALLTGTNSLILPEAFVWHVFYSIANALCYCRYGTNKGPSPGESRWDHIIHGDLKQDNVLLAAPDNDCHRLYPCLKLADFGEALPKLRASYLTDSGQATRILWVNHVRKYRDLKVPGWLEETCISISLTVAAGHVANKRSRFVAPVVEPSNRLFFQY